MVQAMQVTLTIRLSDIAEQAGKATLCPIARTIKVVSIPASRQASSDVFLDDWTRLFSSEESFSPV